MGHGRVFPVADWGEWEGGWGARGIVGEWSGREGGLDVLLVGRGEGGVG